MIDAVTALIVAPFEAIAAFIQPIVDPVAAPVQARFDAVAFAIKAVGQFGFAFRPRLFG